MKTLLKILTTLFILVFAITLNAQEKGCITGNCENGKGELVKKGEKGTATYVGAFKNGKKNGHGTQTGLHNSGVKIVYNGLWKDDKKNGKGTETTNLNNGSVIKYIGEWKSHKKNGKGTRTINNTKNETKTEYIGDWVDDEYSGQGTHIIRTKDGDEYKYTGLWSNNKKNGKGTLILKNSNGDEVEKYIGMWKDENYHGQGELFKNGVLDFKGEFKEGKKHKEFIDATNSESAEGCVSGDCENGFGTKVFNKEKYIGNWKNGNPNGQGTWVNSDKSKAVGNWIDGFQEGVFEVFKSDGTLSHREIWGGKGIGLIKPGCASGDCENGWGKYVWEDGNWYEGNWKNGLQHGSGNLYWYNGNKYFGDWENNLMSGSGTLIWSDGNIYKGELKNGKMNGKGKFYNKEQILTRVGNWIDGEYQIDETGCISGDCENGTGTYLFEIGDKYIGEWKNNKFHGTGTYYLENGDVYHNGQWKDHQKVD